LDAWLTENSKTKKDLVIEYLVRGQLKNGNAFISVRIQSIQFEFLLPLRSQQVVPEKKLTALEKKSKNLHKSVYSVEVKTTSRPLEIPIYEENKV
jgi:hypothetical protein